MLHWIRNCALGIFGLIVVLVVGGALYQIIGSAIDRGRYPPPGKLIDVGGHRLHIYCIGAGSPTVVLDAKGQGWSLDWSTVQPEIAKFTRVCSYDRAGYGWSESGPEPRTAKQAAAELHTLLNKAQIGGPYVLVGHSFSGYTVRIFRHDYPNDVVGIVLVDAAHEDVWQYPERRKAHDSFATMLPAARAASTLGTLRLLATLGKSPFIPEKQMQEMPPEVRSQLRIGLSQSSYMSTVSQEDEALAQSQDEARQSGLLGDLPLVVITANKQAWLAPVPANVDPTTYNAEWVELQKKLVALSTRSSQVMAEQSTHFVPYDQPEVVVEAVRNVFDLVVMNRK